MAARLTPDHTGADVSISCDGFGASGTLTGLATIQGTTDLVLHLDAGGCHATVTVPWNADIQIDGQPVRWVQEDTP